MQITLNIPDAQVARVKDMVATRWLLMEDGNGNRVTPTDALLMQEFKRRIREWIKGEVQQHELLKQHEAIFAAYTPLDVTE